MNFKNEMHSAARQGNILKMESLKSAGMDVNGLMDVNDLRMGITPIYLAAMYGRIDSIEWLKNNGADIHVRKNGVNLLYQAAADGNMNMMHYLVRNGLDINETFFETNTKIITLAMGRANPDFVHGGSIEAMAFCCHYKEQIDLNNQLIQRNIVKHIDQIIAVELNNEVPPYNLEGIFNILNAFRSLEGFEAKKFSFSILQKLQSTIDNHIAINMQKKCDIYYGTNIQLVLSQSVKLKALKQLLKYSKLESSKDPYILKFDTIIQTSIQEIHFSNSKLEQYKILLLKSAYDNLNPLNRGIEFDLLDAVQQFLQAKDTVALFLTTNSYDFQDYLLHSSSQDQNTLVEHFDSDLHSLTYQDASAPICTLGES